VGRIVVLVLQSYNTASMKIDGVSGEFPLFGSENGVLQVLVECVGVFWGFYAARSEGVCAPRIC
jgi:hypothetical protein